MKKVFLMLAFAGLVGSVYEGRYSIGNSEKKACCKDKKAAETKAETK
jgi:hypothetical protein